MLTHSEQPPAPDAAVGGQVSHVASDAASTSRKRLIVNADDLGLSRGITDGILYAHLNGIVTSASFMVNQPATEYALQQLQMVPDLDVGIHLNLCQGKPVLPARNVSTLVGPDGEFLPPSVMAKRLVSLQASSKQIEAEFRAQIDRMLSHGLVPSHADSHHRFHLYPASALAFDRAIRAHGIFRARAARKALWPSSGHGSRAHAGSPLRRWSVYSYNAALQSVVFRRLTMPDAGVALHPNFRGQLGKLPEAWRFALNNMPEGTFEIWCHPGFPEPGFSKTDPLRDQRLVEVKMLGDSSLLATIRDSRIHLTTFQQL
jgi:predicted glycoside hydrolase/deacetylase ChbG (UPF0249 family)